MNSKDNFHLILSELDEEGIIKFAIIPFLESYKRKLQLSKMTYKTIIERFVQLETFYSSFSSVLKESELMKQNHLYSKKFSEYHPEKNEEKFASKEWEEQAELARKKLAINDIKPFLENFKKEIVEKISELNTYLEQQNKSDSDIISMI